MVKKKEKKKEVLSSPMECYIAVKMNGLQLHSSGINLSIIILNENKQVPRRLYIVYIFNKKYKTN